jgi:hypothetical protein
MGFDLAPYPFIPIQVRTIRRQQIQSKPSIKALHLCCHLSGLVHGMTVQDQKDSLASSKHQTIQKAADYTSIQAAFLSHKAHLPTTINRTEQIQPVSCARTSDHRRLPLWPPGRPRMIVAAQTRFIPKLNLRPHLPRFLSNRRVFLLAPFAHPLRIPLLFGEAPLEPSIPYYLRPDLKDKLGSYFLTNWENRSLSAASKKSSRGLGLDSMRERTELSGGLFSVDSCQRTGRVI